MRTLRFLEKTAERIEQADALDQPAAALNTAISKVVRPGAVEDTLSGVSLGHPLHPALVAIPIGAWTSAGVLDALGDDEAARTLIGLGLLTALPAAAAGASDWLSTDGAERRVGFVHAVLNYVGIGAYAASWWVRGRGSRRAGIGLSVGGAAAMSVAGWLGGHLSYAQGVGVDTTAFQQFPAEWTDLTAESELPAEGRTAVADLGGIPILLARRNGALVAMADRCTHRGAPLHEGGVVDGCITCPWHNSAFNLTDGSVRSGPAVRPQPMLETRVREGRVQVRRADERALRTNATGV